MKKVISDYVKLLNGTTKYSGKNRIMFITEPIKGRKVKSIKSAVMLKYGFELPFKLITNDPNK